MALSDVNWILGLSVMFALAMYMTYITVRDTESFFIWLTVFSGFVVWSGLIDLWVLIVLIIVLMLIFVSNLRKRGMRV